MADEMIERIDMTPNPEAWPACSSCGMPFVLRRVMRLGKSPNGALYADWVWQQDCKHRGKRRPPVLVNANGLVT